MSTKPSNRTAKHTASFVEIDPTKIEFAEKTAGSLFWNARKDIDDKYMIELRESIRTDGLAQEIVVRQLPNGRYQVVCGERRLRSILKLIEEGAQCHNLTLGKMQSSKVVYKTMKAKVLYNCSDKQASRISVTENLKRKQLSDLELMSYCKDLCDCRLSNGESAYTREDVCHIINRSQTWVSQTISLYDLPDPAKKALDCGQLPRTVALGLLKVNPACVEQVLRMAELLSQDDCEQRQDMIEDEVDRLREQLNEAEIELAAADAAGTPEERKDARKTRSEIERKLQEAQNRQTTASNREARVNNDTITRATDMVPGARRGKSNGMSQKAVRMEVQKVRQIVSENDTIVNEANQRPYDKRDIELVMLGMEMVLGELPNRMILDALAWRYAKEKRSGWEQFLPEDDDDTSPETVPA